MSDVPVKVKLAVETMIDLRDVLVLPGQSLAVHLRGADGDVVVRLGVSEDGEVEVVREEPAPSPGEETSQARIAQLAGPPPSPRPELEQRVLDAAREYGRAYETYDAAGSRYRSETGDYALKRDTPALRESWEQTVLESCEAAGRAHTALHNAVRALHAAERGEGRS